MSTHQSLISSIRLTPLAGAIATCLSLSAIPAQAAKITVDTPVDEVNTVNSNCTLREAVTAANTNTTVDNCTAGSGEDTIVFGAGLNGQTIILNSGQIDIADAVNPLTIDASVLINGIKISGNNTSRVFRETQGQKLTLSNLVITTGRTTGNSTNFTKISDCSKETFKGGGAICAEDELELINSTVSNSHTTGIHAFGGGFVANSTTLTNSIVSGNGTAGQNTYGGGFYVSSATLTNSIVSDNSTTGDGAYGGGFMSRNVTLTRSTVSGNSTTGDGAFGGGFFAIGNTTLENSTISGNTITRGKGGGFAVSYGPVILNNSTITQNTAEGEGNGDGVFIYTSTDNPPSFTDKRSIKISSTILSGNGTDNIATQTENDEDFGLDLDVTNSLFGDRGNNTPDLAPLADNGCAIPAGAPGTAACVQTHRILATSLALDNGANPEVLETDQRGTGFPRVINGQADIGAFESASTPNVTLTITHGITGSWFDGNNPGQGINVEVLSGNRFLVYWYTYDNGEPIWLTGVGTYSGKTATVEQLETFRGSQFGVNHNQNLVERSTFGSLTVTFSDCNSGTMTYNSVSGLGSGTINLNRLTAIPGLSCTNPTASNQNIALTTMPSMTGSWFDGNNSGQGINVEVLTGNRFLVYWYTYDNGEPIWLTGVGTYSGKTATVEQLESFRGSQFGVNHNQNLVRRSAFGSLTVTFSDCNNGTMVYDSVTGLGNGTINLNRLTNIPGLPCKNPVAVNQ